MRSTTILAEQMSTEFNVLLSCFSFSSDTHGYKFLDAIENGLSKLNFKSFKGGQTKAVEGYLSDQYVFVYSITELGVCVFELLTCSGLFG